MAKKNKRMRAIANQVDMTKIYTIDAAVDILRKCPPVKFDQTVDVSVKLGVDPKRSDQIVRGTVSLPNGIGKTAVVLVFAAGEKIAEALQAGAEYAGSDELLEKVRGGWTGFDVVVATPDMMREVGKLGKILGPRGLMPTPKAGTVTTDVASAVREIKKGKIEFKLDRHGVCNNGVGKVSFSKEAIVENIRALLLAIFRAKPATAKGEYIESIVISSTMGPGLKIGRSEISAM